MGCKCKISVEINTNVSKMIQANSLLFNFQMKSPCYLVTLSLKSSDFQTFLKQYVILVPSFGMLNVALFDLFYLFYLYLQKVYY